MVSTDYFYRADIGFKLQGSEMEFASLQSPQDEGRGVICSTNGILFPGARSGILPCFLERIFSRSSKIFVFFCNDCRDCSDCKACNYCDA